MIRAWVAPLLAAGCAAAAAQTVTLSGSMGDKALLVINGTPRAIAAGSSFQNIKVVSVTPTGAVVELDGQRMPLQLGGAPVAVGGGRPAGDGTQIVLSASDGGHFFTNGTINGRTVRFVVDTGATLVSISESLADRIGLKYADAPRGLVSTANGSVVVHRVSLDAVRIGDVQIYNVDAVVMPAMMETVLLGNSYLSRFTMKREADRMTLDRR